MYIVYRLGNVKGRDHLEDLGMNGKVNLAQDRDQWLALVNTVLNLRFA
jgi:hypothetical protein